MNKGYVKILLGLVIVITISYGTIFSEKAIKNNVINHRGYSSNIEENDVGFEFVFEKDWIKNLRDDEDNVYEINKSIYENKGSKIILVSLYSEEPNILDLVFKVEPKYELFSGEIPLVNDIKYSNGDRSYSSIRFKIDYQDEKGDYVEGLGYWTFTGEDKWFTISMDEKNMPMVETIIMRISPLKILEYNVTWKDR